jgi:nicotinamide mononucleotide transporter
LFFIQGVYGWVNWYKNRDNVTNELKTTHLKLIEYILYGIIMIILYISSVYILKTYTSSSLPYVDSFVSVISLVANWLLAKRKIENWILWIIVNVVYIWLFYYKELYLSAGLYMLFLIMAIDGLYKWLKTYKNV